MTARLVLLWVAVACLTACVWALQKKTEEPLCGPDHPEWMYTRCRVNAEER